MDHKIKESVKIKGEAMGKDEREFVWPELANPWKKVSKPVRLAFLSACFLGGITHIYVITNLILNHDSVGGLYHSNNHLTTGRWSLEILSSFSTKFQLPVVTILIAIVMLALTAAVTVKVLEITNTTITILAAAFIVTIPSVACIFSYMFTADAYFICLFFNALAVYLAKNYSWGWVPAVVLCTIACGGYQAFICYAIALFLMDCILELFTDKPTSKIVQKGIKYIGIVLATLVLYYLILELLLAIKGVNLGSYQGLDEINPTDFVGFLSQIPRAYRDFIQYFKEPPYRTRFYQIVQVMFLFLSSGALLFLVWTFKVYQHLSRLLLLFLGVLLLPLALNFVTILSNGGWVHELMIYSFVLLFVFSLKIVEISLKKMIKNKTPDWPIMYLCSLLLTALLIWNNFCISNIAYLRLQICYENSFATANRIVARIESLDGYSPELPVAIVGEASRKMYGGTENGFSMFNSLTGTNDLLLYTADNYTRTRNFIKHYIGLHMPTPSAEQIEWLNNYEQIKTLPSYPQKGSVVMYDGIIVVKLSDGVIR